jgi:hypothetical protein
MTELSEKLLDEYVRITRAIENVQAKINKYKKKINFVIESAKSEEEQKKHIDEFTKVINMIKNDIGITEKYRELKIRQQELKNILLKGFNTNQESFTNPTVIESMSDTDITLHRLKEKYESEMNNIVFNNDNDDKNNRTNINTKRAIQNENHCTILQELKKNLKQNDFFTSD